MEEKRRMREKAAKVVLLRMLSINTNTLKGAFWGWRLVTSELFSVDAVKRGEEEQRRFSASLLEEQKKRAVLEDSHKERLRQMENEATSHQETAKKLRQQLDEVSSKAQQKEKQVKAVSRERAVRAVVLWHLRWETDQLRQSFMDWRWGQDEEQVVVGVIEEEVPRVEWGARALARWCQVSRQESLRASFVLWRSWRQVKLREEWEQLASQSMVAAERLQSKMARQETAHVQELEALLGEVDLLRARLVVAERRAGEVEDELAFERSLTPVGTQSTTPTVREEMSAIDLLDDEDDILARRAISPPLPAESDARLSSSPASKMMNKLISPKGNSRREERSGRRASNNSGSKETNGRLRNAVGVLKDRMGSRSPTPQQPPQETPTHSSRRESRLPSPQVRSSARLN